MKILYIPNEYSQQRQREKKRWIYPIRMAMEAEYYRRQGHIVDFDPVLTRMDPFTFRPIGYDKIVTEPEGLPFPDLPYPNRSLTKAFDPKYQSNGNFKYTPGTYMLAASGCWHGKCTFCVEQGQKYEVRSVDDVIDEIIEIKRLGFKEVFDDSATFPDGAWLTEFCVKKITHHNGGTKDIKNFPISCNMRIGADVDFNLMYAAGFRMILFGIESGSQRVLDRIKKGTLVQDIIPTIKRASDAGLEPHIAGMVGMPYETEDDCLKTIELFRYLLLHGYAKTAQMSVHRVEGQHPNDWSKKYLNKHINVALHPLFWYNKIKDIRSTDDVKYFIRQIKEGIRIWQD